MREGDTWGLQMQAKDQGFAANQSQLDAKEPQYRFLIFLL